MLLLIKYTLLYGIVLKASWSSAVWQVCLP